MQHVKCFTNFMDQPCLNALHILCENVQFIIRINYFTHLPILRSLYFVTDVQDQGPVFSSVHFIGCLFCKILQNILTFNQHNYECL